MARVWVVAADAAQARIFESANRTGQALGPGRHAMEPPTDLKEMNYSRQACQAMA